MNRGEKGERIQTFASGSVSQFSNVLCKCASVCADPMFTTLSVLHTERWFLWECVRTWNWNSCFYVTNMYGALPIKIPTFHRNSEVTRVERYTVFKMRLRICMPLCIWC